MARLAEVREFAAASPRNGAEKVEILITSLPSVDAFEQVMTGQGGIASSNGQGQIVIECSTLLIAVKARGKAQLAAQGKILLDCPVSGTGAQAARKGLVVFASGDEAAFAAAARCSSASRARRSEGLLVPHTCRSQARRYQLSWVASGRLAQHLIGSRKPMFALGGIASFPELQIFLRAGGISRVRSSRPDQFPKCLLKKLAISVNASLVSGASALIAYSAWLWPS